MAFALAGSGIALLPEWLVAAALADSAGEGDAGV
jgi:DNA-binding transcriptional LysR family regulator